MKDSTQSRQATRRDAMKTGAAFIAAAVTGTHAAAGETVPAEAAAQRQGNPMNPNTTPLAQDHVVIEKTPNVKSHYVHDPGMTRLDNGHLLAATCLRARKRDRFKDFTYLSLSVDGGRTWERVGTIPFSDGTAIVHEGALYLMGQVRQGTDWLIMRSEDEGRMWTEPVTLFKGHYWNCQTSMVRRNGQLYWAMGANMDAHRWYAHVAVACDLERGLLNPKAWRMSNMVEPPFPDLCCRLPKPKNWKGSMSRGLGCLEPNVVQVGDRLMALSRATILNYSTANLGIVFDIRDEGGALRLDFTQYYPIPGGQCKFFIMYDKVTELFFMLANLMTVSGENDRRSLFLFYGRDALTWLPAGCVARMPLMRQSFMYPSAAIDGDDIALISRTSKNGRNQHDADLCTFHRIRNFRDLAMDLRPGR